MVSFILRSYFCYNIHNITYDIAHQEKKSAITEDLKIKSSN